MKVIFFSSDIDTINDLKVRHSIENSVVCTDIDELSKSIKDKDSIVIADYDTMAHEVNLLISSNNVPNNLIVLEKEPEIVTGKSLILHRIKAYGNTRMLTNHYTQMIDTVLQGNVWTYPSLTAELVKSEKSSLLSNDSLSIIKSRLSNKEEEVLYLILGGLTNDAIASKLDITTRTVKAHVSSIFSKLHVNDRLSLVLLLK